MIVWRLLAVLLFLAATPLPSLAQAQTQEEAPAPAISVEPQRGLDRQIEKRLNAIYSEIETLGKVAVSSREGVVSLGGQAANDSAAKRAVEMAQRVDGVIAVEDGIERTLSVEENLNPLWDRATKFIDSARNAWPLYVAALLAFLVVALLGHVLASFKRLWRALAPNPFVADLFAQSIRVFGVLAGLLLALSVLDAMALFGAAAGSAGLVGLAVGFALKDTIENYVASVMLSLRQPFRADDHVVINDYEGIVVRLTSRATILMTLDGNHLRLPNSDVFKGTILNYTLNSQRRFTFKLGVDAEDNPLDASAAGLEALRSPDFLLDEPKPAAYVLEVGDSSIDIQFAAWVDQNEADFAKSRSVAINVVKTVLEEQGFTLPEPIYRLRVEGLATGETRESKGKSKANITELTPSEHKPERAKPASTILADKPDTAPEQDVRRQAAAERQKAPEDDLLSKNRPME